MQPTVNPMSPLTKSSVSRQQKVILTVDTRTSVESFPVSAVSSRKELVVDEQVMEKQEDSTV
jgi:hypothetical protein